MTKRNPRKIQEILGIVMVVVTVILTLALLTFSTVDPPRSTLSTTKNWIGPVGAAVANQCFLLFGVGAYLLIVPPFIAACRLLFNRPSHRLFTHYCAFILLIFSLSALVQVWAESKPAASPVPFAPDARLPGGVIGMGFKAFLQSGFHTLGAVIVLSTMLLIGLLLLTPLSVGEIWRKIRLLGKKRRVAVEPVDELEDIAEETNTPPLPEDAEPPQPPPPVAEAPPVEKAAARPAFVSRPPNPTSPPTFREKLKEEGADIPEMRISVATAGSGFRLPSHQVLSPAPSASRVNEAELMDKAGRIIRKLAEFNLEGSIEAIHPGPVVTLFEFKPAPGVKYSRIVSLLDDLCLGLQAESIRIDRIPGKSTVGIEVPNTQRDIIMIRDIIESPEFQQSRSRLTMALGKRINGDIYLTDLAKMPHLLVAGATGQGKSVGLNTMITSILFKASPDEVKFIFIDPKRLELGMYAEIPHLLTPIVTDAKLAAGALLWAVREMEERYKLLAKYAVKDIDNFNRLAREHEGLADDAGRSDTLRTIPFIVIVIDELAELLSVASKEVELCLQRLAQMARAVGIHIIMATQRPSVEVVTGVIKANFPSRISFRLTTKHDSKTILDQVGAEHLLGKGDMLILPPNSAKLIRVHGAFISEEETKRVVEFLKSQASPQFTEIAPAGGGAEGGGDGGDAAEGGDDPLYDEVARFIVKQRRASTSILQRRFRIGYGRAARLMDLLEEDGVVGPADGSRPRDVLIAPDHYDEVDQTKDPE